MANQLQVEQTKIKGMYKIQLELHGDTRGWFKENYQKEKLQNLGLPDFNPVQNNFSFNSEVGVTRGLHAEPWEKYISLANGKVFGAWVDLRAGDQFGTVFTHEITPEFAFYVPRGIANAYQTLEKDIVYTYLVNAHWSPEAKYSSVNLFDHELNIAWPISEKESIVSDKDKQNPKLSEITAMEI